MLSRLARNLGATQSARPETSSAPRVEDPATTPRAPSRGYFGRRRSANADAKAEAATRARRGEAKRSEVSDARPRVKMPELERHMRMEGVGAYAPAVVDVCARVSPADLTAMRVPQLADLCGELGFDAADVETYRGLFGDNALDGWVFAEIDEWEDYCEIGMKRDHAVVLCCVAKAVKGAFGAPLWVAGPRLTDEEIASLRQADDVAAETGEGAVYGQLIVLGYKEYRVEGSTWHPVGARNEKFALRRRDVANGIRRDAVYLSSAPPDKKDAHHGKYRSAAASHSVTMSVAAGARGADGKPVSAPKRVTVEYVPDAREDMFQLGRMIVPQNDFVVRGPLHLDSGGVLCGPVSRYACRLTCSRRPPYECTLYAAGFNNERDIFLSEQAPKWQLAPGERAADAPPLDDEGKDGGEPDGAQWDALTTFGVRIWKPEIGAWREVSVHGGVHEPRARADVAGKRFALENSTLTNGTIVDLAGIQLLYESAASMRAHERAARAGDRRELSQSGGGRGRSRRPTRRRQRIVARFNARRPQCPVQLHTIRLEYDDDKRRALAQDRRPYIFPACGHVHAFAPELQRVAASLRGSFLSRG
ncbi:hypothetical protein JL720_8123 [Aureococcus anophagefferens]|nr:hypothetical protein JL720_8123 [Aureococcus anophagefferens]